MAAKGGKRHNGRKTVLMGVEFRSRFEAMVGLQLIKRFGIDALLYECIKIGYRVPASKHKYNPDFVLPNGIVIEVKGYMELADRKKYLAIKQSNPDIDLRFVFQKPNTRIGPRSKTTYAMWAEKNGFKWCGGSIPDEWFEEAPRSGRILASLGLVAKEKDK